MNDRILIEACVDSPQSALAAQQGGANRVELCADLFAGGCTPSAGSIRLARRLLSIPVNVIVRPRGGDFCYSEAEYEEMRLDVEFCKQAGVAGVVIGILTPEGVVDVDRTARLIELARPLSVTFHRAFDVDARPVGGARSARRAWRRSYPHLRARTVRARRPRLDRRVDEGCRRPGHHHARGRDHGAKCPQDRDRDRREGNPRVRRGARAQPDALHQSAGLHGGRVAPARIRAQNTTVPGHFRELRRQLD